MKLIDLVFGTRPEAIKMLPLALELKKPDSGLNCRIIVTAQHREMLDQVFSVFGQTSDIDLNIMRPGQTLTEVTTRGLESLEHVFLQRRSDMVLVHGDTTTTLTAALAAFYQQIPVGHVEAGLRSGDLLNPYPEEANRRMADAICNLHFAPTDTSRDNLLRENVAAASIFVTGNTGIDGLKLAVDKFSDAGALSRLPVYNQIRDQRFILVTAHRRENFGQPIENLCYAIIAHLERYPELHVVYPVHPNPSIKEPVHRLLSKVRNVHLLEPLDYGDFIALMDASWFVLTDSGGIQEEAPSLGKPVLVFRRVTERPEAVAAGTVKVIGTERAEIIDWLGRLSAQGDEFEAMQRAVNPYGDGHASARIVAAIRHYLGLEKEPPVDFRPE
jgi:UDP-N-acetylglucosamine 2-epimerase (non-hydrolysing)